MPTRPLDLRCHEWTRRGTCAIGKEIETLTRRTKASTYHQSTISHTELNQQARTRTRTPADEVSGPRVTGVAADDHNLNVVDCDVSVTVPRLSSIPVLKWGSGGYPQLPEVCDL